MRFKRAPYLGLLAALGLAFLLATFTLPEHSHLSSHSHSHSSPSDPSPVESTLIVYAYTERPEYKTNLAFFLDHTVLFHRFACKNTLPCPNAAIPRLKFVLVHNGTCTVDLKPYAPFVEVVTTSGPSESLGGRICYDFGLIGHALRTLGQKEWSRFNYLFAINASVRGPFLPSYVADRAFGWLEIFQRALRGGEKMKLAGLTMNCPDGVGNQILHIQTMLWLAPISYVHTLLLANPRDPELDRVYSNAYFTKEDHERMFSCASNLSVARSRALLSEGMLTQLALLNGDNVATIQSKVPTGYNWTSHALRGGRDQCAGVALDPFYDAGWYDGTTIHPFDSVFYKTNRGVGSELVARASKWAAGHGIPLRGTRGELEPFVGRVRRWNPILVVAHDLQRHGAEMYLARLVGYLVSRGWPVTVLAPREGPLQETFRKLGVYVVVTPSLPKYLNEKPAFFFGFSAMICNTVVCHDAFSGLKQGHRLPIVWVIHESDPLHHLRGARERLLPHYLKSVNRVVFNSRETADVYRREYEAGNGTGWSGRMAYIPGVIDLRWRDASLAKLGAAREQGPARETLRRKLGIPSDAFVVLTVGSVIPRKGQLVVSHAISQLRALEPERNWYAVFVGMVCWESTKVFPGYLENVTLALGIDKPFACNGTRANVTLAGPHGRIEPAMHDPAEYYVAADVHVLHASNEAFPLCVAESMAFGLPQVGTSVFGVPEMYGAEEGIRYAYSANAAGTQGETESVIRALREMAAKSEGERRTMGNRAKAKADAAGWDIREFGDKWDRMVWELVRGGKMPGAIGEGI